jgi:CO/xanthine dehydrogenase Mo-binding subunit
VNAINGAIGIDFMELPITPEKLLVALEAKKTGK